MSLLGNCRTVAIFLGSVCNYACSYCDRDYLTNRDNMRKDQVPSIIRFLTDLSEEVEVDGVTKRYLPIDTISFFGGEPFVFVTVMDEIIAQANEIWPDMKFFIQTNGSLLLRHDWFVRKWASKLRISISYDFSFQGINRSEFDIDSTLALLKDSGVEFVQLQHVLPVNRPDAFSIDHITSIVKIFARHKVNRLSLIPLRHVRGDGRFKTFIDEVPIPALFSKMIQLTHIIKAWGINMVVDGMEHGIEKSYFDDHKQLVIAPDGYLYPEFDFIEYKVTTARVGEWEQRTVINRTTNDDHLIQSRCLECPGRGQCGIKYLYKMFNHQPDDNCLVVNRMYMSIIRHNLKLRDTNLLQTIGI